MREQRTENSGHGSYAFIGFGSAWAEGTTSVVKVDLDRMVRVAAIVTREGQTWLYTGVGYKDWAFFGTRGTATTKHAGASPAPPPLPSECAHGLESLSPLSHPACLHVHRTRASE